MTDWKGQTQLRINQIRLATEEDDLEMSDFVKSAPEKPIDMYEYIIGEINAMQDEDFKKLCLHLYEGNKEKLMYYPAAMSNHHAEYGGLLYHIKRMMMSANRLCEVYTNLSRDLWLLELRFTISRSSMRFCRIRTAYRQAIRLRDRCSGISYRGLLL